MCFFFFGQIRLGHPHRIQIAEVVQSNGSWSSTCGMEPNEMKNKHLYPYTENLRSCVTLEKIQSNEYGQVFYANHIY